MNGELVKLLIWEHGKNGDKIFEVSGIPSNKVMEGEGMEGNHMGQIEFSSIGYIAT